jgi:anaphase-promoting complex subunit 3
LGHLERGANLIYPFLCIIQKNGEALELLEQAIVADPKNPLPKYQKANVLMSEERYHDALAELEQLKEVAPRESSVYFLMGKIYKRLDMLERAIYHFCIALDLKPSASDVNLIKVRVSMLLFLYFHPCSLYACV